MNKKDENNEIILSVIVITYGQEKYIKQAVDSIIMQKTNFKFEIIVGNDCSPDNTANILNEYKNGENYIFRIFNREKNVGPTKNLYLTIKEAKGKYVAFLEGDDYWTDENKLQMQVDFLEDPQNEKYVAVAADFNDVDLDGKFLIKHSDNIQYHKRYSNFKILQNGSLGFHGNSLLCRNIFFTKIKDFSIIYKIDNLVADKIIPLLLTDFGDIYILDKVVGCYRLVHNRYNLRPAEHTLNMLRLYRKLEKYEFENHKIDFSNYKGKKIVDVILLSIIEKKKIMKEEAKEIFCDFNLKIMFYAIIYFIYKVIQLPIIAYKKIEIAKNKINNRK